MYVGTGNNYSEPATATSDAIVALDMKTGRIVWTRQTRPGDILNGNCQSKNTCPGPDYDFGASPILENWTAAATCYWSGRSRGSCMRSIRIKTGRSCGRLVWGRAA